jgi:hypothetical protein
MKRSVIEVLLLSLFSTSCWGASGSWPAGATGLKNGTVPGPGYYFLDFLYVYSSDDFHDRHGDKGQGH